MGDMMKIAICLAVKNEKDDIPYWVAWHSSIGFDSFFIYDDQSSDSTSYVINSLREKYDIRLKNVREDRDDHVIRQVDIYNSCLSEAKEDFDWLCFIDSDEYVYIDSGSIKSFLQQMPEDAGCVALNWCCFGTNGHLSRPEGSPIFSYRKHGNNTEYWNNHTKVIIRPRSVNGDITYVHNAPVTGRTLTSDGKDVVWTTIFGGFTAQSPNWENARLLHFQTRSLENYIRRYKDMEIHRRQNAGDPVHDVMNSKLYDAEFMQIDNAIISKYSDELMILVDAQLKYIEKLMKSTSIMEIKLLAERLDLSRFDVFVPARDHKTHQLETRCVSIHNYGGINIDADVSVLRLKAHTGASLFIDETDRSRRIILLRLSFLVSMFKVRVIFIL
ncbi:glycosyltransferase family 2 protein [Asaia prunellae]|uniref:glycosyltransferase family 2 protein n=1 Tax=Asaia prunellae TaxID=610245 RepID=UPI0009FC0AA7|nr:glycosyltransferase family 2 protein [Asaia prunellae]